MAKTDDAQPTTMPVKTASPARVAAFRTGLSAESRATAFLMAKGYRILAKRFRTPYGEIDIVARDGDTTVFVEAKARATAEYGAGAEAVTPAKQRRLVSMAVDYLARNRLTERPCRFDVVAIDGAGFDRKITVYLGAFTAS